MERVLELETPEKMKLSLPDKGEFISSYVPSFDNNCQIDGLYIVLSEKSSDTAKSDILNEKFLSCENFILEYLRQFNIIIESNPSDMDKILNSMVEITNYIDKSVFVKFLFDERFFISENFLNSPNNIREEVEVKGVSRGFIEIGFQENSKIYFEKTNQVSSYIKILANRIGRIVERIEAVRALNEEKEWLNTTLSSIGDGIIATDSRGRVKFINPVAEKMIGISNEESVGKNIKSVFNVISELDRSASPVPIETVLNGKAISLSNHTVLLSHDGSEYAISDSFAPIKTEDGHVQGAIINFRDVTREKEYQKKLELRESMLDQLLENMSSGVIVFRTNDNGESFIVNNINIAAEKSEGVKREDVIGKNIVDAFEIVRGTELPDVLKKVWKTGKTETFSFVLKKENQIINWKENNIYKIPSGEVVVVYTELTEEKKKQELIRVSEESFRNLAEQSKDIIYRFLPYPEPKFEFISPSVEHITGYTQKDFYSDFHLIVERTKSEKGNKLYETNGKYFLNGIVEFQFARKDREIIWLEMKNSPTYNENGDLITINGIMRDITKQKELENSLKAKKKELEQLIANLPGFVAIYDPEKKRTEYTSGQGEYITEFSTEESLHPDFNWANRVHKDDREKYENSVECSLKNRVPYKEEYRFITKSGKCRIFFEQGSVFKDENGKTKLESFTEDVTELRKSERKLVESLKTYDSIFNNKHTTMLIIDPVSHRIMDANIAAQEFYGYPFDEITKLRITDLNAFEVEDNSPLKFDGPDEKSIHNSRHRLADGSVREVVVYCGPLFREGEKLIFSIIHDMTKQNEAERSLKKTLEELQKTLAGIIDLTSKMVELRDPYTAGHQKRVSLLAVEIAKKLDLSNEKIEEIRIASLLHDIGKTSVPSELLSKPGELSRIEMQIIEKHPEIAYELLKEMNFKGSIAKIILQHHERLDGSGYPCGLKKYEILFGAKILAVSDVVEAMASHRPYRPAPGLKEALKELKMNSGKLYDSKIVNACLEVFEKGFTF